VEELKLAEFRVLYNHWRRRVPWIDQLILGFLVWMEKQLLDHRVKVEVDQAVEEYHREMDKVDVDYVSRVYSESPSETSTSLPEMRLTAPWYVDTNKQK